MRENLAQIFFGLLVHPTFWVTATAWLGTCLLKVLLLRIQTGLFYWNRFFGSGGMPSSHTAFASALTVSIGISVGFNSAVCGLALGVTILTAVDATGLRRSAGLQAELLNKMASEFYRSKKSRPPKVKEALGHTLPEVLAGAVIGAVIVYLLYPRPV